VITRGRRSRYLASMRSTHRLAGSLAWPPADLEICQSVFDAIERELDTRLDVAAPAAE